MPAPGGRAREEEPVMKNASAHPFPRVLVRTARSGVYLVRGVPRDLQRTARSRAAREATTLSSVLRQALREYAEGTWTPGPADT